MENEAWMYGAPPDALGAVVHGPALLARDVGIAVGLRCVFAYAGGLLLPLALAVRGEPANLAGAVSFGNDPAPTLRLVATMNGKSGAVESWRTEGLGGSGRYDLHSTYWISELPTDDRLRLTVAWPEIGLSETGTDLLLSELTDLENRVISLT